MSDELPYGLVRCDRCGQAVLAHLLATHQQRPTECEPGARGTCESCGGPIRRTLNVGSNRHTGPWLHVHRRDWQDRPHDAVPKGVIT